VSEREGGTGVHRESDNWRFIVAVNLNQISLPQLQVSWSVSQAGDTNTDLVHERTLANATSDDTTAPNVGSENFI